MRLMPCSKRVHRAPAPNGAAPIELASRSFVAACVGLYLGMSAHTAAAQGVGRLQVDFISPTLADDQNLGTYSFPTTPIDIPFFSLPGVGAALNLGLGSESFVLSNRTTETLRIPANQQAIIKVTTLDSRIVSSVEPLLAIGFNLEPGSLQFGNNFYQVNLAGAVIDPVGLQSFSVAYNLGAAPEPTPVPAPASLPLLVSGLAVLASVRFATRNGGRVP